MEGEPLHRGGTSGYSRHQHCGRLALDADVPEGPSTSMLESVFIKLTSATPHHFLLVSALVQALKEERVEAVVSLGWSCQQ